MDITQQYHRIFFTQHVPKDVITITDIGSHEDNVSNGNINNKHLSNQD